MLFEKFRKRVKKEISSIVNEKIFMLYIAATGYNKDAEQLFSMNSIFKQAYDMYCDNTDPGSFVVIESGGKEEFMRHKAAILSKKLIWMNDKCKDMLGKRFITRRIDLESPEAIVEFALEFGSFLDTIE